MNLRPPFVVFAGLLPNVLLPAVRVGDLYISIEFTRPTIDNRARFLCYFDRIGYFDSLKNQINSGSFSGEFHSGVGGCGLQEAFANVLTCLGKAGPSLDYSLQPDAPSGPQCFFSHHVVDWASKHTVEIVALAKHLKQHKDLIEPEPARTMKILAYIYDGHPYCVACTKANAARGHFTNAINIGTQAPLVRLLQLSELVCGSVVPESAVAAFAGLRSAAKATRDTLRLDENDIPVGSMDREGRRIHPVLDRNELKAHSDSSRPVTCWGCPEVLWQRE